MQTFTVLRVLVCENRIVYCAGRIRRFSREKTQPGSAALHRREHRADSVQTLVTPTTRMQEVKTFGLILYLAQSIKRGMFRTLRPQVGVVIEKTIRSPGRRWHEVEGR